MGEIKKRSIRNNGETSLKKNTKRMVMDKPRTQASGKKIRDS